MTDFPYCRYVPTDLLENLKFRAAMRKLGAESPEWRDALIKACRVDPLFWINTFAWTEDPRLSGETEVPFITYPHQEKLIRGMWPLLGKQDIGIEKSRCQGATWICLLLLDHALLFSKTKRHFVLVSRTANMVDSTNDPDALFPKLDFIHERLPGWMLPKLERRNSFIRNPVNGMVGRGEATVGDIVRGGRPWVVMLDEFAAFPLKDGFEALKSTQHATRCRLFNSTYKYGSATAYYQQIRRPTTRVFRLSWQSHPLDSAGLYTAHDGKLRILDKHYEFPPDYKFILDGKIRSPYYDHEVSRMIDPSMAAEELDIDPAGADRRFVDHAAIEGLVKQHARPPLREGTFDPKTMTFSPQPDGPLKIWGALDQLWRPIPGDYTIGIDIAAGMGASDSAAVIWDDRTRTKAAEYTNPEINPTEFASFCAALGKWFRDASGRPAYIIYEANGRGGEFGVELVERIAYSGGIWMRRDETRLDKREQPKPGWWSNRESKRLVLEQLAQSMKRGLVVNRSERAIRELGRYKLSEDGSIVHIGAETALDPTARRENHGDLAIADALAVYRLAELGAATDRPPDQREIPQNCLLARLIERGVWPEDADILYN